MKWRESLLISMFLSKTGVLIKSFFNPPESDIAFWKKEPDWRAVFPNVSWVVKPPPACVGREAAPSTCTTFVCGFATGRFRWARVLRWMTKQGDWGTCGTNEQPFAGFFWNLEECDFPVVVSFTKNSTWIFSTLSPRMMEVENCPNLKETYLGGTHFPLPWLQEEDYMFTPTYR